MFRRLSWRTIRDIWTVLVLLQVFAAIVISPLFWISAVLSWFIGTYHTIDVSDIYQDQDREDE